MVGHPMQIDLPTGTAWHIEKAPPKLSLRAQLPGARVFDLCAQSLRAAKASGVSLSDRRVVKLLKLFAASAYLDGRPGPDASDLFVMKHVWNSEDQAPILEALVTPVLETHYREHPDTRRVGAVGVGIEALAGEIERVRQVLTGPGGVTDVQLFSQLKALGETKTALSSSTDPRALELIGRVDQLLEAAFRSGRFGI